MKLRLLVTLCLCLCLSLSGGCTSLARELFATSGSETVETVPVDYRPGLMQYGDTVTALEISLYEMITDVRREHKLFQRSLIPELQQLARQRAEEVAQVYSEYRPSGRRARTIFEEYPALDRYYGTPSKEVRGRNFSSPDRMLNFWLASQKDANIILNKQLLYYGVGLCIKNGVYYWVFVSAI